ncbi:hypothetical protein, partial [Actinokineospora bangkokensis]|uniref:hypothetical protein n=1 Tax=Actinokineospora bangkokensis TaxID=1193682 RepID=UPI000A71C7CC
GCRRGGGGGGGGGPVQPGYRSGSGAGPLRAGRRDRRDEPPPGLPAVLAGKGGRVDPFSLVPTRSRRRPEDEAPVTVELVDEDLWKVEDETADRVITPAPGVPGR